MSTTYNDLPFFSLQLTTSLERPILFFSRYPINWFFSFIGIWQVQYLLSVITNLPAFNEESSVQQLYYQEDSVPGLFHFVLYIFLDHKWRALCEKFNKGAIVSSTIIVSPKDCAFFRLFLKRLNKGSVFDKRLSDGIVLSSKCQYFNNNVKWLYLRLYFIWIWWKRSW